MITCPGWMIMIVVAETGAMVDGIQVKARPPGWGGHAPNCPSSCGRRCVGWLLMRISILYMITALTQLEIKSLGEVAMHYKVPILERVGKEILCGVTMPYMISILRGVVWWLLLVMLTL